MNKIPAYMKKMGRSLLSAITLCVALSSCDNAIYDNEGDCSVTYQVAFRYDRNMAWADAFAREVKSVHLYAFDKSGTLAWQGSESGEALGKAGYTMTLDLQPGDYRLVAWCGMETEEESNETFSVPEARVGETKIDSLRCALIRERDNAGAYCKQKLLPLFHGTRDVSLPVDNDGGTHTYTMDLTKNTNHIRIILQQLSGEPVNVKDFTFRIETENGLMNHDNQLLPDETITYWAYATKAGTANLGINDYPGVKDRKTTKSEARAITSVNVAIADLSIGRLIEGRETNLIVESADGTKTSACIPLADYALMIKDGYDEEMSNQDYLDRQDEYTLTFFLDENRKWIETSIIINSWKVVLDDIHFE